MSLIVAFGDLSGFSINWKKSVLMPLDKLSVPLPKCARSVQIVSHFRYLGTQVSPNLSRDIELNLIPLIQKFQDRCTTRCKVPLSMVGRINLINMVWGPQLYIFHNARIWIPCKWFLEPYRFSIQGANMAQKNACISLATLQYGKDQGGMAVPHARVYLASQLQQLGAGGHVDSWDPICKIINPQGANALFWRQDFHI